MSLHLLFYIFLIYLFIFLFCSKLKSRIHSFRFFLSLTTKNPFFEFDLKGSNLLDEKKNYSEKLTKLALLFTFPLKT